MRRSERLPLKMPLENLSRRQILQAGAIPLLGLGLPGLLSANSPTANMGSTAKSCIFIFQYGGLSQLDSWDPKPFAPAEVRGPYQPIATSVPGFQVAIGRDHWPHCYSAMLAGAGVRGGTIYGSSDSQAAYVKDHKVTPEDFAATLFHAMNIPPETRISPDGFTRPASTGQVIEELF